MDLTLYIEDLLKDQKYCPVKGEYILEIPIHTLTKRVKLEYFREIFTSSSFKGGVSIKAFLVDKLKHYVSLSIIVPGRVEEITLS